MTEHRRTFLRMLAGAGLGFGSIGLPGKLLAGRHRGCAPMCTPPCCPLVTSSVNANQIYCDNPLPNGTTVYGNGLVCAWGTSGSNVSNIQATLNNTAGTPLLPTLLQPVIPGLTWAFWWNLNSVVGQAVTLNVTGTVSSGTVVPYTATVVIGAHNMPGYY